MEAALSTENLMLEINGRVILSDLSLSLEKGVFAALCGRNGAGKSQLLRCLKGLRKPSGGRIFMDGMETSPKERMKKVALVFQNAEMQIVAQSVEKDIAFGPENLGLDRAEVRRRVEEALHLMGLEDKARQGPQTLSGGELRKTAIAGVLAMKPSVILLDEPFANLDYPSTLAVMRSLISLHEEGYTILVVSHEAEKFLAHTDMLFIMENGRLVSSGSSSVIYRSLPEHDIYIPRGAAFEELSWLRG